MLIRHETSADIPAITNINQQAFGRAGEADLVNSLRQVTAIISLVAELDDQLVGHILFSPVQYDQAPTSITIWGLGPLAVLPSQQAKGVGSALVKAGLEACRQAQIQALIVLGGPAYYQRFGFQPAANWHLRCHYPVDAQFFMAQELSVGSLADLDGTISYHPAFDTV
ncbi:GNAT family N-acetyltransferase [Herpetosiphon llansteffanensis]|uniref:GNAT family N-acetyltransferase n=1 Tax=Herpetosiphon llansteffanensis TaxID=2094568 RepID=UPI000D7CC78D|nr:N-acetyltransferase [Herpetosiphon llansteffanensis]